MSWIEGQRRKLETLINREGKNVDKFERVIRRFESQLRRPHLRKNDADKIRRDIRKYQDKIADSQTTIKDIQIDVETISDLIGTWKSNKDAYEGRLKKIRSWR